MRHLLITLFMLLIPMTTWAQVGTVDSISVTPGPLIGIYQAPIQNPWNVVIQQICPGCPMSWAQGTMFLYVEIPNVQIGDILDVWAQAGIKGADVYTGRVATGCGVNVVPDAQWLGAINGNPAPPSSVGEDWNSDVRPYVEHAMHQAFVAQAAGKHWAYFRCYAAVNTPAPGGYLKAMWPHGSILVLRYAHP